MEDRLIKLRARMKMQKDTATKTGGWASSKTEKGSLTKYARDVRHRISQKKLKKQSNRRRFRRKSKEQQEMKPRREVKKCKDKVESWECEDVLHWLESTIGLPKYCDVFKSNSIDGRVLLEMGSDDLDFLSIRFPAHRKMILKGVDSLKEKNMTTTKKIHWTEATFKAEQRARENPSHASVPVNLADDQGQQNSLLQGTYDEAAQRRAFQEAVMAWRNGDSSDTSSSSKSKTLMWKNPFGEEEEEKKNGGSLLDGDYDEAAQRKAFQEAVMEWRNAGKKKEKKKKNVTTTETSTHGGGSYVLNEELERERFKKAVHQWRATRHKDKSQESAELVKNLQLQMDIEHDMKIKNIQSEKEQYYRSFDDDVKTETREIEARLEELLLRKEKETTATPLEYNVWDVDIKF
eukprot:g513.t1